MSTALRRVVQPSLKSQPPCTSQSFCSRAWARRRGHARNHTGSPSTLLLVADLDSGAVYCLWAGFALFLATGAAITIDAGRYRHLPFPGPAWSLPAAAV